jgi:hypothetical protein
MLGWLASNPAGVSFSIVVINGFAVTATVIVTGGPVYVAPDAAPDDAAAGAEADPAGADVAADGALAVVAAGAAELVDDAFGLLELHADKTIEPTETIAISDTFAPRCLSGRTCTGSSSVNAGVRSAMVMPTDLCSNEHVVCSPERLKFTVDFRKRQDRVPLLWPTRYVEDVSCRPKNPPGCGRLRW